MIKKELLDILVCPACKVKLDQVSDGLKCTACARVFPIEDGIPVMLIDREKYEKTPEKEPD